MKHSSVLARWLLEQEALALSARLERLKPFALLEPMLPAAGLLPAAQVAIERYLSEGRSHMRRRVARYLAWLRTDGRNAAPREQQRHFTLLRLGFHASLDELDLFADALTQRSEADTGVWLAGLDVAAQDALTPAAPFAALPPVVCYLDRGLGGAIRRARTRLPTGGQSPAAIIRIPRERMIGFGIASSLVHEVGHQVAAMLGLVESLRPALQRMQERAPATERPAWAYWERTVSESVADLHGVARVGIAATLGLIGTVSLPARFVFRIVPDDPHPSPWIRVLLSCAMGQALYPHRQWAELAATWRAMYPPDALDAAPRRALDNLQVSLPRYVDLLVSHSTPAMRGRSLREILASPDRNPATLLAGFKAWQARPGLIEEVSPTLAFAALGRARITGTLNPGAEDRLLGRLITHWALQSTLEAAAQASGTAAGRVNAPRPTVPRARPVPPTTARIAASLAPVPIS
jgi:hypothetical protein